MGQADALSRKPRASLDDLKPEALAYDWVHHRLFIAEDLQHRVMVYDAHPDRVGGPTKALAVIGQPDAFSTHPAVGPDRVAMPRLAVEPETQKLYISEGFPAGNRISIFDITPALLHGPEQIADLPVPVAESPGAVRIGHPERSHLVEYLAPNSVFNSLPRQRSSPHLRPDDRLVTIDRVLHHASLGVA